MNEEAIWHTHTPGGCPFPGDTIVEVRFANDPWDATPTFGRAKEFNWGKLPEGGEIASYRVLEATRGTGKRSNAGKPPMHLIPAMLVGQIFVVYDALAREAPRPFSALWALERLGEFQMRQGTTTAIDALLALGPPHAVLIEAAEVFDFGARKYGTWNWARGMTWSICIGSAVRHLMAVRACEETDPESGLPHRGHAACNLLMLAWYQTAYPEGDDRPPPVK